MNDTSSVLVAHCGAKMVTRDDLKAIPVPEGTRTHQPLSHFEIVEVLEEALSFRHLSIVKDEYAVSADGMKMFGVMDLNSEFNSGRFSIGLRNSNDKSMRLALTAGYRVFVCDNMAFSGDFAPLLHKHTRNLELRDSISIAVDRIHRGFGSMENQIESMQRFFLTDDDARLALYQAFVDGRIKAIPKYLLPLVHENYFNPDREEFRPRNLWSLSNAFTSAFKQLAPIKQFEITARLGTYLRELQQGIGQLQKPKVDADSENAGDSREIRDFDIRDFHQTDDPEDVAESGEFDQYDDQEAQLEAMDHAVDEMIERSSQKMAA